MEAYFEPALKVKFLSATLVMLYWELTFFKALVWGKLNSRRRVHVCHVHRCLQEFEDSRSIVYGAQEAVLLSYFPCPNCSLQDLHRHNRDDYHTYKVAQDYTCTAEASPCSAH